MKSRQVVTRLMCAVVLFGGGVACSAESTGDGSVESVGEIRAAVTYDTQMAKPMPTAFLTRKTDNTICCSGLNQQTACNSPCATASGLITQAGYDKAFDYYRATGQDTLDTLDKWKAFYNFPKQIPGEPTDIFRRRTNVVIYYNRTELALGRELGCAQSSDPGVAIACYVTNYGDAFESVHDLLHPDADPTSGLAYARQIGAQPKNTVVISYDTRRETTVGDGSAVQFAAFGPDGKRLQKAQLDDQGARPIPEICMTCHGGVWDPQSRAANGLTIPAIGSYWGIARFARFLPLVTSTVTFTGSPPYTLAEQEPAIMAVNQAAWRARGTALTERQKHLMIWLYSPTTNGDSVSGLVARRTAMMQDTLSFSSSSPNAQWAANAWPGDWGASIPLYNGVVLPYCDTCHLAMDPSSSWHDMNGAAIPGGGRNPQWGLAYNWLDSRFTSRDHVDTLAGQMGVNIGSGTWNTDRTQFAMPHAENAFARFWGDKSGAGGFTCTLAGNVFPPADCLLADLGIWPLSGRAAPKSATNPSGIDYQSVRPSTERDCGQSSTSSSSTVGANAGRRLAGVALPAPLTSTFVNQCADGCTTVMFCPGAETVYDSNKFPGARQECVPNTLSYGSCVSCGRIGEPACAQVGPTCNTNLNPNCQNLPACHEGVKGASGLCETSDLTRNGWATASQSSWNQYYPASRAIDGNYSGWWNDNSVTHTDYTTDTQPWWKVDLAWTRKVKFINLYNRSDCCSNRLGNFVVEYSTDNTNWTLVPGADFTGVFPTNASYIPLVIPKAIDARYIRVRHLLGGPPGENFSIISLAEVSVLGWN